MSTQTRAATIRTLEPGLLEITTRGVFTLADAQALVEATRRQPGEPPFSVLAIVKESGGLSAEARSFLAKELKPGWIDLTAMVGASFAVRVAAKGVFLATTLLGKDPVDMVFVDTVEEGLARLRAHRAARASRPAGT